MGVLKYSPTGRAPWIEVASLATVAATAGLEVEAARKGLKRAGFGPVTPHPAGERAALYDLVAAVKLLNGRPGKGRRKEARTK